MRYDLTVPLARVVAQYESQLSLPFKRYHIAPVFAANDRSGGAIASFISATPISSGWRRWRRMLK